MVDSDPPAITNVDPVVGKMCKFHFDYHGTPADYDWVTTATGAGTSTRTWTNVATNAVFQEVADTNNTKLSQSISAPDEAQLTFSPSYQVLSLPLTPGTTWGQTNIVITGPNFIVDVASSSNVAVGWENVTVPAGAYRAIKLTTTEDSLVRGQTVRETADHSTWLSPASYCGTVKFDWLNSSGVHASRALTGEPL